MFVVAQSDEPVRVLAGSPDPRSHKKIIPTRITKNPPTATRGRWCCPGWPLLLAAIPTAGSPRQYELAYARPTGPWLPFATLEITQTTYRGHDVDLSFDPVLNVVPGLETYDWAAQLRRFSYAASRRAREHRNGQPTSQ